MFENIIEQGAVYQLRDDILGGKCAPSMLFYGPSETGKGSAALELARVLSCGKDASWKCSCPSCERHRYLQYDDLLMLGKKSFTAEITACGSVFQKNPSNQGAKLLFYRSLRKLQLRFSPVLTEDDPKIGKLSSTLQSFDERLNELLRVNGDSQSATVDKLCASLIKDAVTLDDEGLSALIPIGHIRNASYWCRLAPNGKRKVLIIENAQNMREEARNSLLKLLEEPPAAVSIVITSQRREAIMPTILSRLRPYRFMKRSAEGEKEVLRRVFQETAPQSFNGEGSMITSYLESFLSQNTEKLYPLAAWFVVSLARIAAISYKKNNGDNIPSYITEIGSRYSQAAESSGFERVVRIAPLVKTLAAKSGNFENDSFSRFLKLCFDLFAAVDRKSVV